MIKGLDISSYQEGINFDAIKNAGYKFLILRAGFTGWGTGESYNKDNQFETFYSQAKAKGIPVGAYWYSCADNYQKGVNEANYMYNNCLSGKQFEYPVYIDVEDVHWQVNNKAGVTQAIIGFCETLENKGYYVGIYASDISGFKEKMNIDQLSAYDKWVARYGSSPKYATTYGMWQTSSSGRINGYNSNLDTDEANKDYPTIIKSAGLNGFSKGTQVDPVPVAPTPIKSVDELATEVINGDWGNGEDRKNKLVNAGYDYNAVQSKVNELMAKPSADILDLVKKTIRGDFGNGEARKNALGNNYAEVQRQVNLNIQNGLTRWDNIKLF